MTDATASGLGGAAAASGEKPGWSREETALAGKRIRYRSTLSFDVVLARLRARVGQITVADLLDPATSREEFEKKVEQHTGDSGDRDHREEDAAPVRQLEQPAADDRPQRDRHARDRAPQADRPGALAPLGEHVCDQ